MARWARKVSPEDRERFERMMAEARANATTEIRDGREFTVLTLPDRYGASDRVDEDVALDTTPDED